MLTPILTPPSEAQWQRAAQGDTNWAYPWGDDWDGARCNNRVGKNNTTTPVTRYAGRDKGDSPFGVSDLAGNVWNGVQHSITAAATT
jgi:formylglycine-generating enzyme required for sulfatase activity